MNKIDFMAGLPAVQVGARSVADLGLEVGQTWRTNGGDMVTVSRARDGRFDLVWASDGSPFSGSVDPRGVSKLNFCRDYDLVERVQRVYIAGPMTGYVDLNFPAFNAAAAEYRRRGCFVINPAEMNGGADEPEAYAKMSAEQKEEHWRKCMKKDIAALLTCDMIVMLDGWTRSKGANIEHYNARALGMTIAYPVDTYKGEVTA